LILLEAEVCNALNATKENIINNFDIPSKVYAKEVTKLTDETACLMPNENNVKRNLRRIRNIHILQFLPKNLC